MLLRLVLSQLHLRDFDWRILEHRNRRIPSGADLESVGFVELVFLGPFTRCVLGLTNLKSTRSFEARDIRTRCVFCITRWGPISEVQNVTAWTLDRCRLTNLKTIGFAQRIFWRSIKGSGNVFLYRDD